MARGNFDAAMVYIFREEGGFTGDRRDTGNWTGGKVGAGSLRGTNYGISAAAYPSLDIKGLTKDRAAALYRADYADKCGFDDLPIGADLSILDIAVNAGTGRAKSMAASTAGLAPVPRIQAIAAKRAAWYRGIRNFAIYGKTWLGRVARIEAAALKMALGAVNTPAVAAAALAAHAAEAGNRTRKAASQAKAALGAVSVPAAAAPVHAAASGTDIMVWIACSLAVLALGAVAAIRWHAARADAARAAALTAEAGQ